jgi:hypothetical protein
LVRNISTLDSVSFFVNNPAVFRKCITLFLFGFWLLPFQPGLSLNNDLPTSSSAQKLAKPNPPAVKDAIGSKEYRQKAPVDPISARATASHSTAKRDSAQRNRIMSELLRKSIKIYKLNRVFLV